MTESTYPDWLVLHVPHDSDDIPPAVFSQFLLDEAGLRRELILMTDHRTFDLFQASRCGRRAVRAGVSRLVVDVERFVDDASEPMAARGMGVIYTRTSALAPLRRELREDERGALLDRYYHPHHARLASLVDETLKRCGRCLVLDCHSFPSRPLPYEPDQTPLRSDICIGTDAFHTPPALVEAFVAAFESSGCSVRLNSPFAGALVPMTHYQKDPRVKAVMIEVNRRLYLDETLGRALPAFDEMSEKIVHACRQACTAWTG